jgi:hypothetical protein
MAILLNPRKLLTNCSRHLNDFLNQDFPTNVTLLYCGERVELVLGRKCFFIIAKISFLK